jgi:hypothetical protein
MSGARGNSQGTLKGTDTRACCQVVALERVDDGGNVLVIDLVPAIGQELRRRAHAKLSDSMA